MHVMHFRELVKEMMGVPTQQQRLTVGTTVLEDWDEEGNIMLLQNYPAVYDGATIYLIQLTEGRIFQTHTYFSPQSCSFQNISHKFQAVRIQHSYPYHMYDYINIPNPKVSISHFESTHCIWFPCVIV